jgi:hypothetical protein
MAAGPGRLFQRRMLRIVALSKCGKVYNILISLNNRILQKLVQYGWQL